MVVLNRVMTCWVLATGLMAVSGCGDGASKIETHPVKGIVMFEGKPVADATITFTPKEGPPARAKSDEEGRFTLSTYDTGDGAIAGEHTVSIVKLTGGTDSGDLASSVEQGGDPSKMGESNVKSAVPELYQTPQFSPLKFKIPHEGEIQIEL